VSTNTESRTDQFKRAYAPPTLVTYGSAARLTRAKTAGSRDSTTHSGGSDRSLKEHVSEVDRQDILTKLSALPIATWNYKDQDSSVRHIGPMAQDFASAFRVGENDKRIFPIDADGVALASIQALHEMVADRDSRIGALENQLESLKQELQDFRSHSGG